MAYCNNCGTNIPDEATFCTNCGTELFSEVGLDDTPAASDTSTTSQTPAAQQDETLALLALIFGILGFVVGWAPAIAAIILGAIAINQGDRSDKAKAGLILGIIATVLPVVLAILSVAALILFYIVYFVIFIIIYIVYFAVTAGAYGVGF